MRQRRLPHPRPEVRELVDRVPDAVADARLHALAERLLDHAHPQARDRAVETLGVVPPRLVKAGRVHRILARDHREQQGGVPDAPRERPDRVERGRERDQPVPADQPVGRLEPHHPRERRRLPNRAAGVGPERPHGLPRRDQASRDRRRAAAARAAGHQVEVPRVVDRSERRVLVRRPHRELVAVGLAEQHPSVGPQALPGRAVVRRDVGLQDLRSARRGHAPRRQHVLQRERDPRGLRRVTRGDACVGRPRLLTRELVGPRQERADAPVDRVDASDARLEDLDGRALPRAERGRELARCSVAQLGHSTSTTLGTLNRSSSTSGAFDRTSSVVSEGVISSGRRTFDLAIA